MIDDIQFITGKESTQEEFFHTFNALVDQNKQIIISADKAPSDLTGIDERLRSRLAWGLVADIQPTSYELRLGILQSKRAQLQANVPDSRAGIPCP
jgi:chromosomal replication initiator protein